LIINAIRKELVDVEAWTKLDYARHLWMEKEIKSVANITAADVHSFLAIAEQAGLRPVTKVYPMEEANQALWELKNRPTPGAKVLMNS
jgi:propanol-preferring alcohol dehydrogenase